MNQTQRAPIDHLECALRAASPSGCEMSLIDLVLFACDLSEDATEVNDIVDGLIENGAARILPIERDPLLGQEISRSAAAA